MHISGLAQTGSTGRLQPLFDFDYSKPLFKLSEEQASNKKRFLRYSALTGYREGVKPFQGQFGINYQWVEDSVSGTKRFAMYNLSVVEMLLGHAYSLKGMVKKAGIVLEVSDPSKYFYDVKYGDLEEWKRKNALCFEYAMPNQFSPALGDAQQEIARMLGVTYGFEKRPYKTLVLVRTSDKEKFKAAGGSQIVDLKNGKYTNASLLGMIGSFQYYSNQLYFNDETGLPESYLASVDLNITNWDDLAELRKALQRYDLDLKEELREQTVFVIKELK